MKKTFIHCLIAAFTITGFVEAQTGGIPRGEPTPQEIEKRKRQVEEYREELIDTFLYTLEGDEFQKQIIGQYLNSYIDEKMKLLDREYSNYEEKERVYNNLNETHFQDLTNLISENDMKSIQDFITGNFDQKKAKKAKKKREKEKKN